MIWTRLYSFAYNRVIWYKDHYCPLQRERNTVVRQQLPAGCKEKKKRALSAARIGRALLLSPAPLRAAQGTGDPLWAPGPGSGLSMSPAHTCGWWTFPVEDPGVLAQGQTEPFKPRLHPWLIAPSGITIRLWDTKFGAVCFRTTESHDVSTQTGFYDFY